MAVIESMVKQGLGGAQLPFSYYDWYTTKRSSGGGGDVQCRYWNLTDPFHTQCEEHLQQKATSLSIPDFVKSTTVHLGCALAL